MHSLLQKQLQKYFRGTPPKDIAGFLEIIDATYLQFDQDRLMLQRTLDLTSDEMLEMNRDLARDFERLKQTESARDQLLAQLQATLDSTADGILVVLLDGSVILHNRKFDEMWRLPPNVIEEKNDTAYLTFILSQLNEPSAYLARVKDLYERPRDESRDLIFFQDGRVFDRYSRPYLEGASVLGRVWSFRDITDFYNTQQQLLHDALHDSLTGLANRTLFMDHLDGAIKRRLRKHEFKFAVLFLDLDRFKVINDGLGHSVGDRLLIELSQRLLKCIRTTDTAARLGGDEFVILLEDFVSEDEVRAIADRIHGEIEKSFNIEGNEIFVSVSIGIALGSAGYRMAQELLRDADTAMYGAKQTGRAKHQFFDETMRTLALYRLEMETALRKAIENDELSMVYQPVISASDGKIRGFEALMRWKSPGRGFVMPGEFIPIAEDTGLINSMGRWAFKTSLKQLQIWRSQGYRDLFMAINLSPIQVRERNCADFLLDLISDTGLPPSSVHLEMTETKLMENREEIYEVLEKLASAGVRLAIDDFGTGYSSLAYLKRFQISTLKIDRSFVSELPAHRENLNITKAISALASSLEIRTIAEGVETAEQMNTLISLGCDWMQGYFFSRPMPVEKASAFLSA